MSSFAPKVLWVSDDVQAMKPATFKDEVSEQTLEKHVLAHPEVLGEPMLVLGSQLQEFEEDRDRLDVLAVDTDGEVVLIELKVTDDFRVTDLQALAYAGAYATRSSKELAETLRRRREKLLQADGTAESQSVSLDEAKDEIVSFLELEDFDAWQPSRRVKIKLVAPRFPQRVLHNVKYLGEEYGMPVEAIAARVFKNPSGGLVITFERLLPLPGDEEFQLTLRSRGAAGGGSTLKRRPRVVPLLLESGTLADGQTVYVHKSVLPLESRDKHYDPDSPAFQAIVQANGAGAVKFRWKPDAEAEEKVLAPSAVAHELYLAVLEDWDGTAFSSPVATSFTLEPNGKTLADVAQDEGLWSPAEADQ